MAYPPTEKELREREESNRLADEASERLFKSGMELGKPSLLDKINPKNWPAGLKSKAKLALAAAVGAGLTALLGPEITGAIMSVLFGGG